MSETELLRKIQVALSAIGARVFRNQVGSYELKDGRWISSGLCQGSSDLIGWKVVTITQEMVGKSAAIFCAIEVKTPTGRVTKEQQQFIDAVRKAGGFALVARSAEEAVDFLRGEIGKQS